jgi:hypothetical protein
VRVAVQPIGTVAAIQRVVAITAMQLIVIGIAIELVVAGAAVKNVVAGSAVEHVQGPRRIVVTRRTRGIPRSIGAEGVSLIATIQRIRARSAVEIVNAGIAVE